MSIVVMVVAAMSGCRQRLVATAPGRSPQVDEIYPSKYSLWIPGSYAYKHGKYRWKNGRYKKVSAAKPVFIAGHWKQTDSGLVWVRGKWRKF